MERQAASGIVLTFLLIGILTLTFDIKPAQAEDIYIYNFEIAVIPEFPTTLDEINIRVSFHVTYIDWQWWGVKFGSVSQIGNKFFVHIDIQPLVIIMIYPPPPPTPTYWEHTYSLGKLSAGSYSFIATLTVQGDGYGQYSKSFTVQPPIIATVDIDPDTLNLRSEGQWITTYIELPEGYNPSDIDVSSIRLDGSIPVDPDAPTQIGDYDGDGIIDLMVKFDRATVESYIYHDKGIKYGDVTLTITGRLFDGTPFEGSDTIFVKYAGDANKDGTINILDAAMVSAHWYPGPAVGPLGYDAIADFNNDGAVNILDAGILSVNWGQTVP